MAAKNKNTRSGGNGGAHDDAVVVELKRIFEEMRDQGARQDARMDALTAEVHTQGERQDARMDALTAEVHAQGERQDARMDALTAEVRSQGAELRSHGARLDALGAETRANGTELRAVRDILIEAVARDHRRVDALEVA